MQRWLSLHTLPSTNHSNYSCSLRHGQSTHMTHAGAAPHCCRNALLSPRRPPPHPTHYALDRTHTSHRVDPESLAEQGDPRDTCLNTRLTGPQHYYHRSSYGYKDDVTHAIDGHYWAQSHDNHCGDPESTHTCSPDPQHPSSQPIHREFRN